MGTDELLWTSPLSSHKGHVDDSEICFRLQSLHFSLIHTSLFEANGLSVQRQHMSYRQILYILQQQRGDLSLITVRHTARKAEEKEKKTTRDGT